MNYPPVNNFARLLSWSEANTLSRFEHEFPESPRVVNVTAELEPDKKVADANVICITVHESLDDGNKESFGNLSFPKRDEPKFMAANIKLTEHEFDRFLAFMRCYGISQPMSICFQLSVYESSVPEKVLLYERWEGKPFLKIVEFQYLFEMRVAPNKAMEIDV